MSRRSIQGDTGLVLEAQNEDEANSLLSYTKKHRIRKLAELIRAVSAEFMATLLLILLGCGVPIVNDQGRQIIPNAIGFGTLVTTLIFAFEDHSGAIFNPAVTMALVIVREMSILRGFLYIIAQLLGASAGAGLLYVLLPDQFQSIQYLSTTRLADGVSPVRGCLLEVAMTAFLVFVVLNVAIAPNKPESIKRVVPFIVGFVVIAMTLFGGPLTGASMNPARSFGPALVNNYWDAHWVFWIGPFTGAILAVLYFAFHHTTYFFRPATGRDQY